MTDFSPTKYIEKNVKIQYRNFDANQWHTVTVIQVYGHNENIFLGKFVYCDIKFNSGEIYNHFIFTDKEFESTSDNAWKFARPWSASINEIRQLNQKLNNTSFDYYNSTSNTNHFSDIGSIYKVNNEIEEYEGDNEGDNEGDDEWEDDDGAEEDDEDEWEAEWEEWEDKKCEDECEDDDCECEDEECEDEDDDCEDECEDEEEDECEDDEEDECEEECEDDEEDEEDETTIVIHLYPRLWSTVLVSTVVSTLATTLIIYASNIACSIY
jgi:hypothetical protein